MKTTTTQLTITLMVTALVTCFFFSCSTDNMTAPEANQTTTRSEQNYSKGDANRICDWTDWGEIHNSCMDILDDSLVNRPPSSFSNQEAIIIWTVNMISDHMINELGYDTALVNPVRRDLLENGRPVTSLTNFQSDVEELIAQALISSREYDYLIRLSYILYTLSWSETQRSDSLTSFKNDVNGISWNSNEKIIVPVMSIAYYSWNWRLTGLDDSDPDHLFSIDWISVLLGDAHAGLIGAGAGMIVGQPELGAITAVAWSATEIGCWLKYD